MTPILNQILFKPLPSDEISEFGLFIPETARKPSDKGIIVKVGRGTAKQPMTLKEGMTAFRVKDWGQEIMIGNELHFLMDSGTTYFIHYT